MSSSRSAPPLSRPRTPTGQTPARRATRAAAATAPKAATPPVRRAARSDGQEARQHLLLTALALFAEKGFDKTSTREIARAAGANIAAISYYFGDKAGLYAACFTEPVGGPASDKALQLDTKNLTPKEGLRLFLLAYMEPLKQGEIVRQCIRLHMREMLEASSLWAAEVERDIKGPHLLLVDILSRHLGVPPDDDIHRLAFAITGLPMQLFVTQEFVDAINPALMRDAASIDRWAEQLVLYAYELLDGEAARRKARATPASAPAGSSRPRTRTKKTQP